MKKSSATRRYREVLRRCRQSPGQKPGQQLFYAGDDDQRDHISVHNDHTSQGPQDWSRTDLAHGQAQRKRPEN